ncbi:hypothetical protein Agub_g7019 [Astrephomene gubernaculifera]|uniref:Cyclic nucleotide-binding domain-containing protein n=1 Tax=Astrephomene gubernaculifera TaxID=47775 RepID=A0AAD3DS46_9CHLO|nr:hypothetical protein Agub_g7019 [Astrephomene gubernaculifera]
MAPPKSASTRAHFRGAEKGLGRTPTMEQSDDGHVPAQGMPEMDATGTLGKFSYKFEEMTANVPRKQMERTLSRSRRQASLKRTYSQYNLEVLNNTYDIKRENMMGIYGLMARHIDVPLSIWERLAPLVSKLHRNSLFGTSMLHPYSPLAVYWRLAMLLFDLTFTAFWVPLNVGFCYTTYGDWSQTCTRTDLAGGIVYVVNLLLGFQMGVVLSSGTKRAVLMDGPEVSRMYIMYGKFVMDFLASIPLFVLFYAISSPHLSNAGRLLGLLSLLRLVRLMRLGNTVKVVYQDSLSGHYRMSWVTQRVSVSHMYLIILLYQFLVIINLTASLMILLAAYYGYETTWYDSMKWVDFRGGGGGGDGGEAMSPAVLWMHASYWVTTVLTTAGQGQAPRRLGEQIVSNFCSVYGMVFNGLVVGVVGRALIQASNHATALYCSRKEVGRVSYWARLRHLPASVMKELQVYFADTELSRRDFNFEQGVIDGLPSTLRKQVVRHIVRPLVDKVHIFSTAEPELRDLLSELFTPVEVPPGHDLCIQGTLADRLWLLESGDVVALRHKEANTNPTNGNVALLGEGVLLRGMMDVASTRPWTLRTRSACRLWELRWEELEPLLRVYPRLINHALWDIRDRLIRELERIPRRDTYWNEMAAVLARILKQPSLLDSADKNLEALVGAHDNPSMALLFSSWLEAGINTTLELGGGATGRRRGLVTMSLMLARQSKDALGASSFVPFGGACLAAPSPALSFQYGRGGGGGGIPGLGVSMADVAAMLGHAPSGGGGGDGSVAGLERQRSSQLIPGQEASHGGGGSGGGMCGGALTSGAAEAATLGVSSGGGGGLASMGSGGGGGGGTGERPSWSATASAAAAAPGVAGGTMQPPPLGLGTANRPPPAPSRLSVATDATHLPDPAVNPSGASHSQLPHFPHYNLQQQQQYHHQQQQPFGVLGPFSERRNAVGNGSVGGLHGSHSETEVASLRCDSLTQIAHTTSAFRFVDAGGSPLVRRPNHHQPVLPTVHSVSAAEVDDGPSDGAAGSTAAGGTVLSNAVISAVMENFDYFAVAGDGEGASSTQHPAAGSARAVAEATEITEASSLSAYETREADGVAVQDPRQLPRPPYSPSIRGGGAAAGGGHSNVPSGTYRQQPSAVFPGSGGGAAGSPSQLRPLPPLPPHPSAFAAAADVARSPSLPPACNAPALCPTCGKCTCPVCRTRTLAASMALDQGTAVVGPPMPLASMAAAAAAAAATTAAVRRPSLDLASTSIGMGFGLRMGMMSAGGGDTTAGTTVGAGTAAVRPPGAPAAWVRASSGGRHHGGGHHHGHHHGGHSGGGHQHETWMRRRMSIRVDG